MRLGFAPPSVKRSQFVALGRNQCTGGLKERLTARLAQLFRESESPSEEMDYAAKRLNEAGLCHWFPGSTTTPEECAAALIRDNWLLHEQLTWLRVWLDDLEAIETAEQLVSMLLPASCE